MIEIRQGGMIGRIGRFLWINGSDHCSDPLENTFATGGYNRFGSVVFMRHGGAWRILAPDSPFQFDN
jgi:hypothetical protein